MALLVGLVVYTGAFIAEVVRAGIQAVPKGQTEAARAQGFTNGQILRLIVLPQALRVIIPPLISQYLNLVKNSSLALAIGFLDLYAVSTTMLNQSGRVVEIFLIVMATYLTISLTISLLMNIFNRRVQIVER
jgi:general L-amino acid transport system permease protein